MVLRIVLFSAVAYLVLVAVMYVAQRKLLYLPTRSAVKPSYVAAAGLRYWPNESAPRGYIAESLETPAKGTVVVFHGNAGEALDRNYYRDALTPLGYRVVLAQYPGYGGRDGAPTEEAIVSDALETLAALRRQFDGPLFLWGESLGAGVVASIVTHDETQTDGLVLLTPWDSLTSLASSIYWFMPVRWLIQDHYNSIANLRDYEGPIAVITAGQDRVIPNKHSERLFDKLETEKQRWHFSEAGHNSWPISPSGEWWREVMEFVSSE